MEEGKPSRTAWGAASHRAIHQLIDAPLVFEDPLALKIMTPDGEALVRAHLDGDREPARRIMRSLMVARHRLTEDTLAAAIDRGVRQYVLLGAGLDTFACRNPYPGLRVFEVDYPATQAWKKTHLAGAGIEPPACLTFAPINFEHELLIDGLTRAGVDAKAPAVFAWLGVVPYLTRQAIMATLSTVAAFPSGSQIVFDYGEPRENLPLAAQLFAKARMERMAAIGEPWISFFQPADIAAELTRLGFTGVEDFNGEALNAMFFADRDDGLAMPRTAHLMRATV